MFKGSFCEHAIIIAYAQKPWLNTPAGASSIVLEVLIVGLNLHIQPYFIYHDIVSGGEITPCNKIDKPLVVYRFSGKIMTSITMLHT